MMKYEYEQKDRAFLIIKHEAVQRGLIGEIITRLERKGLKITAMKMFKMTDDEVRKLYSNCVSLPFFDEMLRFNSRCAVVGIAVEGPDANKGANEVCGKVGVSGTVRGDFALCHSRNVLHCSDENMTDREIAIFFNEDEICRYSSAGEEWLI